MPNTPLNMVQKLKTISRAFYVDNTLHKKNMGDAVLGNTYFVLYQKTYATADNMFARLIP